MEKAHIIILIFLSIRCRKWARFAGIAEDAFADHKFNLHHFICSEHFEDTQFAVPAERKKLNWNAIPTISNYLNVSDFDPIPFNHPSTHPKDQGQTSSPTKRKLSPHPHLNQKKFKLENLPSPSKSSPSSSSPSKMKKKLKVLRNKLYRRNIFNNKVCEILLNSIIWSFHYWTAP